MDWRVTMMDHELVTDVTHVNYPVDEELRRLVFRPDILPDSAVREAFLLLEKRIRLTAGLPNSVLGHDLADKAFHPETGVLQPISPMPAERKGVHELFHGAFLFYRNPVSHRDVFHDRESMAHAVNFANHLLSLVRRAVDLTVSLDRFMGHHEGIVKRRRDFRLDIDDDGENEVIVLLDTGPVLRRGTDPNHGQFLAVILDKVDGNLRRIPADSILGFSFYGPLSAELVRITGGDRPDLLLSWYVGENGIARYIFRWDGNRYVVVERERSREEEASNLEKGYYDYEYQPVQVVDFDGDGQSEVVQHFRWYGLDATSEDEQRFPEPPNPEALVSRCEVWKWDSHKQRMVMIDETAIATATTYGDELTG
jgi:uncharacterized protein (TIGR02391 family)